MQAAVAGRLDPSAAAAPERPGWVCSSTSAGWWRVQEARQRARLLTVDVTMTLSPCRSCCSDLRDLTGAGRDADVKAATVAWRKLFQGGRGGVGATDTDALRNLTDNTPWKIVRRRVGQVDYPSEQP